MLFSRLGLTFAFFLVAEKEFGLALRTPEPTAPPSEPEVGKPLAEVTSATSATPAWTPAEASSSSAASSASSSLLSSSSPLSASSSSTASSTEELDSCGRCSAWAAAERKLGLDWLRELNARFKCPCRVDIWTFSVTPRQGSYDANVEWVQDNGCRYRGLPWCFYYHHGAFACLRSKETLAMGARQQCCYDNRGVIIGAGVEAAGTPDKSVANHLEEDVVTYVHCCKGCSDPNVCNLYVDEVRRGDTSHCS